jgi:hypothetical protein
MKLPKIYIFTILYLVVLASCKHDPQIPIVDVCYDTQIQPIFQKNCNTSGCHDATKSGGYSFLTHENSLLAVQPNNYKESLLYKTIKSDNAPHNNLSQSDINSIMIWIQNGASGKKCLPPPTPAPVVPVCDTNNFTYSTTIKPIFQTSCYGCHSVANKDNSGGGIDLETYSELFGYASDINLLYASVAHSNGANPMPKNGTKLEDCKIIQIKKWVQAGALNN